MLISNFRIPIISQILSWEFCSRHHEELLQRSFIIPQVINPLSVQSVFCKQHEFSDRDYPKIK